MTEEIWGRLAGRMSTMGGFPGWSETMADNYFADLCDLPENVAAAMIPSVQKQFDARPSVKQLREWAQSLVASSSRGQLPDYLTPKAALTGPPMANPAVSVMGLLTEAGRETKRQGGTIPPAAREAIRWLRSREADNAGTPVVARADTGNWGLEHVSPDGSVVRLAARYSEAAARAKAEEQSRKYSHLRVRVWCAENKSSENKSSENVEAVRLDREKEAAA